MLRKDYIMKLIQQMIDSLFLLLNKKDMDEDERKEQLSQLYKSYTGEAEIFYLNTPLKDILIFLEKEYGQEEVLYRIEMLSEIMYHDGMLENDPETKKLKLLKTLSLLNFLEERSNTYSITRIGKIDKIKSCFAIDYK